jgi:HK97 family phage major capsid protein
MLKQKLVESREKLGRAIKDARETGTKIREAQAANQPIGELEAKFELQNGEAVTLAKEVNRLQAEINLELEEQRLNTPTERLGYRSSSEIAAIINGGEFKTRRERRNAERQMHARMEMFGRAGVTTRDEFERFREAHSDATPAFLLNGAGAAMAVFERAGFKPREAFALVTTQGDLGGFLTSDDLQAEVLRDLPAFTSIRPNARILPTGGPAITFPTIASATGTRKSKYGSGYTGSWKSEGYVTGGATPTVQNQPRFGQARIPVHVWAPDAVELTSELMSDSKADVEAILAELIAETYGLDAEDAHINGSGVGQPLGLLNTLDDTKLTEVKSGDAAAVKYNGLIDLFSNLPAQYRKNAKWLMNSLTFGAILKLADSSGLPLFPVNQTPGQLWGKEVLFSEFMPDVAANAMPIIFGDFRYYGIADRQELRVQRLVEKYAPNIGILPTAREGGQPIRTDAFRKQKIAA